MPRGSGCNRRQSRASNSAATPSASQSDLLIRWLTTDELLVGRHRRVILFERAGARSGILDELIQVIRNHYTAPEVVERRLADLGAPNTAALLREHLPSSNRQRSGDLGEILATEYATRRLGFEVPIRRLQWKDGREMAMHGDDIVAFMRSNEGRHCFLKGEAKSRGNLTDAVIQEAAHKLDSNDGRPSRQSVLFVADRLRERGEDDKAIFLEETLLFSFQNVAIEHLLFTLSGNNPESCLYDHIRTYRGQKPRHAAGLRIEDHSAFIALVYEEL